MHATDPPPVGIPGTDGRAQLDKKIKKSKNISTCLLYACCFLNKKLKIQKYLC
jgi:hypothetical protein